MPDRLLHKCPQLRLHVVARPLRVGEAVLGAPISDRRMPMLASSSTFWLAHPLAGSRPRRATP
jgi:hypothetical protein